MDFSVKQIRWIIANKPRTRLIILVFIDLVILFSSFTIAFIEDIASLNNLEFFFVFSQILLITFLIYFVTGQYKSLTRYVGSKSFYAVSIRNLIIVILSFLSTNIFHPNLFFEIRDFFIFWLALTALTSSSRVFLRDTLLKVISFSANNKRVAIYGAGSAGAQLFASLRLSGSYNVITIIDDNPNLWNRNFNGIKIKPINFLKEIKNNIDLVLLAIPSLNRKEKLKILDDLDDIGVPALQIPSLEELTAGRKITSLKPFPISDLLCRETITAPVTKKIEPYFYDSVCFVTGAGGSIGSELCRLIISYKPSKLIIFERNEPSLFLLEQELLKEISPSTKLISVLGCAQDQKLLSNLFIENNVDYVFHAAAYKHVPLVESNPIQGILNNVFSTDSVCKAAIISNIKKVILISSDKAVRPANIMGASKRLSEMIFQANAEEYKNKLSDSNHNTVFSIVRFGNVLGSSGSVVPTFINQIASGGPITITDPEIIRYFMTISEAAQLVIQASIFAEGGEVFLLDMGDPVKILDLAKTMIRLSGLTPVDDDNPNGDIEIICTGLRPGEKLYEELLIGNESTSTEHPLIYKAKENNISKSLLWPKLIRLKNEIYNLNNSLVLETLSELVPEWKRKK